MSNCIMGLFWWMSFDPVSNVSERLVTVSPTDSHSAIGHNTDPVSAHASAKSTSSSGWFLRENLGKEVASEWPIQKLKRVTFIFRRLRYHNRQ